MSRHGYRHWLTWAVALHSTLLDGLIHLWHLDELSGNRADAVGSATLSDNNAAGSGAGKNGQAASFQESLSQYLSAGQVLPVDTDLTLMSWMKMDAGDVSNAAYAPFKSKASAADQHGIFIESLWAGAFHRLTNRRGFGTTIELGDNRGAWILLQYEYVHGTTTTRCRAFGSVSNDGVWTSGSVADLGAATGFFSLGIQEPFGGGAVGFLMDEVALWNRALTEAEATEFYNGGAGKFYPF